MSTARKAIKFGEANVERVVRRLVEVFDPEYVYLFGSRARGDFRETSDYDFMVIVGDDFPEEMRSGATRSTLLADLHVYHDVKIYKRASFERQLHLKASMPSTVLREGKLLYKREGTRVLRGADTTTESYVSEGQPPEYNAVLIENTREWIGRVKRDIRGAQFYLGDSPEGAEESLFHSQQAIEKAMKAFLVWHDFPPKKIHDFKELAADCLKLDPSLEPVLKHIDQLDAWSVKGRYPHEGPPGTVDQAEEGLTIARSVLKAILERMPAAVAEPAKDGDK